MVYKGIQYDKGKHGKQDMQGYAGYTITLGYTRVCRVYLVYLLCWYNNLLH